MKNTLRFFAFLDMLSFLLLSEQVVHILVNIGNLPPETLSAIRVVLLVIMYLLLLVSAYYLVRIKKQGLIVYYIQFPMRLLVWVFSFGFITLTSQYFSNPLVFDWLFRIAIILEFFRLYYTIQIHRRYFRGMRRPG
ncbi:hypothetical protein GZH53_18780 [Flavihumibacter sp. R14]|nr:hypothetical protein [Flavihumibacter soli]